MQPRQRSKCCATVAFSAIVPSRRASMRWMRPRGESISSRQSTYVGHVGRQNPQWTQSEVYSRITRRALPAGRARARSARRARRRRVGRPCDTVSLGALAACTRRRRRGGSPLRRARASISARSPGAKRTRPVAAAWRSRDSSHTAVSASAPPTSAARVATCAATARSDPSNSTATRPGWRTSSALGWSCEPSRRAATPRRVLGLDDERPRRLRQRVQPEARARDERETSLGAAHESREVVAGDVLDDLAARARDRPVREHERRAEDEVARRAEAVAERAGDVPRQQRADRRIARRIEREPLAGRGERRAELGQPDPGLDGAREVARVVLEDAVEAVGGEVVADPQPPALGVRGRERAEASSRLETLGNADPLERVDAVRPGHLAAEPRRRDHLARIADARPGRTRGAAARTPAGRAPRTSAASSTPCPCRRRARR